MASDEDEEDDNRLETSRKQRRESELVQRYSGSEEEDSTEDHEGNHGEEEDEEDDDDDDKQDNVSGGKSTKKRKVTREGGAHRKRHSVGRTTTPTSGMEENEDDSSEGEESNAMADDGFVSLNENEGKGKDGKMAQGQRDVLKSLVKKTLFPRVKYIKSAEELTVTGGIAKMVFEELGKTEAPIEDKLRWWTEERKNIIRIELGFKRNNVSSVMKQKFFGKNVLSIVAGC